MKTTAARLLLTAGIIGVVAVLTHAQGLGSAVSDDSSIPAGADGSRTRTLLASTAGVTWEFATAPADDSSSSTPPGALTVGYRDSDGGSLLQAVLSVGQDGTLYLNGEPSRRSGQLDALEARVAALEGRSSATVDALKGQIAALERKVASQESSLATAAFRRGSDIDRLKRTIDSHRHR